MGYVKRTLAPGEDFLYRAHFNWTYDFRSWFWLILGFAPALFWIIAFGLSGARPGFGFSFLAVSAFALFCGVMILLSRYIHRWVTVIGVTSMRLIVKTGLVSRDTHEVNLDKIEEVLVHQSVLGRVLGYGAITIRGTGIGVIEFPILGAPLEIRREIEAAMLSAKMARAGGGETA